MKCKVFTSLAFAALAGLLVSCNSPSQSDSEAARYDAAAIEALDMMSEKIATLSSCSFTLDTINSTDPSNEIRNEHDVYMRAPDKMYVHTVGTAGEKGYWYNGAKLAYFSYSERKYATVEAPDNILKAIDAGSKTYGIDFPAADFFYPDLTDDILDNYDDVYFSEEEIDGISNASVTAINSDEVVQIWIDQATYLPYRMVIQSKLDHNNYYDVVFSNWKTNQELPDTLFEFQPPSSSEETTLSAKN